MLPRSARAAAAAALFVISAFGALSCERVPLLAPTGSTITLVAQATALSSNGSTQILGQVLEASGTPPHSGTHVTFTTSLGRIEPSDVSTDIGGRVMVTFHANGASGTATITALSGGATTGSEGAVKIAVGAAAAGGISVAANPGQLPTTGGTTTITATVVDVNGSALVGVPVNFLTTAGSLSSGVATSDAQGRATTTLTTTVKAEVTAQVGIASGGDSGTTVKEAKVTVNVSLAPTLSITGPSAAVNVGAAASFTFNIAVPTGGNPIRDTFVTWGDGQSLPLGGSTGTVTQSHSYNTPGNYVVSATTTDIAGISTSASASVVVVGAPSGVEIVPEFGSVSAGVPLKFTITVTLPAGVTIQHGAVNWGDGSSNDTFSTVSATRNHTYLVGGSTYQVSATVIDSLGRSYTGTTQVRVN